MFNKIVELGLEQPFKNPRLGVTLFLPNNEAFKRVVAAVEGSPKVLTNATLVKQAMYYHIINRPRKARDFAAGTSQVPTALGGQKLIVTSNKARGGDGALKVGAYNVVTRDIKAGKSVVHVIDGFLVAPSLIPTMLQATTEAAAARGAVNGAAAAAAGKQAVKELVAPAAAAKAEEAAKAPAAKAQQKPAAAAKAA